MAMSTALAISMTGMKAAQGQLDLIARNVSNVDTVGYTRKTAGQEAVVTAGRGYGVSLNDTTRFVDEGLLKSFLSSNATSASFASRYAYLSKVDVMLGTPLGDNSIAASMSSLQTAFETLSADVTSASGRYNLLSTATSLTARLNSLSTEIQKLRGEADLEVAGTVEDVNHYLDEINALNQSIAKYTVLNYDGLADLQDKRDQALRDLSGLIDIYYFTRENGEIVIQTTDGVQLLDKDPHYLSHSAISQGNASIGYENGGIGGIYVDGKDITRNIMDGEMQGLIYIRDNTLVTLQDQIDNLAVVLKEEINQVHNRGTAFPQTPSVLEGSRSFIDPAVQTIRIDKGDVRFSIFDLDGNEVVSTNLIGGLGFSSGTINDLASTVQTWLQSPTGGNLPNAVAAVDPVTGKLTINTNDSNYTISILDEVSSTPGVEQQDASLSFDANGDGVYDRTFEGFSYFFGLNDFFTEAVTQESMYDSTVMNPNLRLGLSASTTLSFSSSTNGLNYASITVNPNDTLRDIADRINNDPVAGQDIRASIIPSGNGYILRISNIDGEQLEISENPPVGLSERLGFEPSKAGLASSITVLESLRINPNLIAAGSPVFNFSTGEYELNSGRNNISNDMAKAFTDPQTFGQTGNLARTAATLANYASTFVGLVATETSATKADAAYQVELTSSLSLKEAQLSGVDQDEELAQMILFQQSYAACAKSFTAAKEMLDMLLSLV